MGKHAYLLIANRNPKQLQYLINCIDDNRNDIYLLKDKKSSKISYNFIVQYSYIYYLKPINIYWGSYTLIQAELMLFKAASVGHYDYYHLLSELDLPLVNQDKLHDFFDINSGKEFLSYGNPSNLYNIDNRIKHHLFRKHYRINSFYLNIFRKTENNILNMIPQYKISHNKLSYSSQWVSIDDELVKLIISNIHWIYSVFHDGYLVDELFVPILINYYPYFADKIYYDKPMHNIENEFQGNLRYINWWDGSPYVWKYKDYPKLLKAKNMGHMFSRKFDLNVDSQIFFKIFGDITK